MDEQLRGCRGVTLVEANACQSGQRICIVRMGGEMSEESLCRFCGMVFVKGCGLLDRLRKADSRKRCRQDGNEYWKTCDAKQKATHVRKMRAGSLMTPTPSEDSAAMLRKAMERY